MSGGGNSEQSQATGTVARAIEETRRRSALRGFLTRLVREKPLGTVGGIIVLILFLSGIFADFLAPYGYKETHVADRLSPPGFSGYLLGTDSVGRDMLSRIIYGARVSMIVALAASGLSAFVSVLIGLPSGYLSGKFDIVVQRFVDAWIVLPGLVIYLLLISLFGAGMLQIILVLGISGGIGGSRVIGSAVIAIKENVYIQAANAIGASTGRVLWRHLLPNIVPIVIISFTLGMAGVILAEASLSFLGFGIPPPFPSWGQMISGQARLHMERAPWLPLWPGVALALAVYGINMFGDALRDLLDPRLRGSER